MPRPDSPNIMDADRTVIEEEIQIRASDGTADGFLFRPEGGGRWPGVIHLTDIGGIRQSHRDIARRLAAQGYTVLMPNVFYRTGRPPLFDFTPQYPFQGDERTSKRFIELARPLTPEAMERDGLDYARFLAACVGVSQGAMGIFGYSVTGSMVLRTAAAWPDKFAAAAAFHAGGLCNDAAMSPHLLLPRIQARLYFGHAVHDHMMREESIEKLERVLAAWGGTYESEIYEGAYHGWTVTDSPLYNERQAERAFQKLFEVFEVTLKDGREGGRDGF
jgi:carboxymethylenebutenolidase